MSKRLTSNMKRIKLTCINCKITVIINTTKPELYTQEVKDKFKCLNCSYKKPTR